MKDSEIQVSKATAWEPSGAYYNGRPEFIGGRADKSL
jgi:hypothetical protein